ncbi:MAG: TIGR03960 family B12-binding radical SAM protein [Clostridiales bacterium]|nr:TIGR03960 family B12-binding radical SAM protein [Clostridiales bacterium]
MLREQIEQILPAVQKPARYIGGEVNSVVKHKDKIDIRYAFCFPDTYEIGMSHLGMKILYGLVNERADSWCERVFAPESDMEEQMRAHDIPVFGLESLEPIRDFDLIGFTMQYELSYTNVLNMLDLAGVPLRSADRTALAPLVICGGPCVCNPEPVADFFDLVLPGEGEEITNELIDLLKEAKAMGMDKQSFLREAAKLEGVYVPSLYEVSYHRDGTIAAFTPKGGAPDTVKKRVISDLDDVYYPDRFVVPFVSIVHDRAVEEIFRGCIRGCRFCQAGFIYRPIREKRAETVSRQVRDLCDNTGYDEVSLCSLSTSDHQEIEPMLDQLIAWSVSQGIRLSLPSLRVDNFSDHLMEQLGKVRKSSLTFAPEAGTQRLRDVINKNITEEEVLATCAAAFQNGWTNVKLYFMIGLPTETMEDVAGIADLAHKVVDLFYASPDRPKGKSVSVSISVSTFIPKPFTPFQWEPEDGMETVKAKQAHLMSCIRSRKISVSWHDSRISLIEGAFARGDRKLCGVLETAWRMGCKFDSWDTQFNFDAWTAAFAAHGLTADWYACRRRGAGEVLPWDHLDYGIRKDFFLREMARAREGATTPHCRQRCAACGANLLNGGACDARS